MPKVSLTVWVVVAGMCVFWGVLGSLMLPAARSHDFLNLYTGARLALEGRFAEMHEPSVQLAEERKIYPELGTLVPFVRPAFYSLVLAPLGLLPYGAAFTAWIALQTALLLGAWAWAWRRFGGDALVFSAMFLPGPLGIASGQDCALLLALLICAYELERRGRAGAAGAVLALMLMKFHLVLLWPVALTVQKRWRMLAGFCAAAAAEVAGCLALGGWRGAEAYARLLLNKDLDRLSPTPEFMISVQGLAANLGIEGAWFPAVFGLCVCAALVWALRGAPVWRMFVLAPMASLLIVPHVYGYDAALLLVPVWLAIFEDGWPAGRIAATLFSTPVPFGFALAGKPYSVVASLSLAAFFLVQAAGAVRARRG